mmetsp:Transcript_16615/g.51981  ORF Transcript_16615/g.51981 Transcript_16615/m.51981 type:complete len:345 (+) Transcript_16615:1492-2526(+)
MRREERHRRRRHRHRQDRGPRRGSRLTIPDLAALAPADDQRRAEFGADRGAVRHAGPELAALTHHRADLGREQGHGLPGPLRDRALGRRGHRRRRRRGRHARRRRRQREGRVEPHDRDRGRLRRLLFMGLRDLRQRRPLLGPLPRRRIPGRPRAVLDRRERHDAARHRRLRGRRRGPPRLHAEHQGRRRRPGRDRRLEPRHPGRRRRRRRRRGDDDQQQRERDAPARPVPGDRRRRERVRTARERRDGDVRRGPAGDAGRGGVLDVRLGFRHAAEAVDARGGGRGQRLRGLLRRGAEPQVADRGLPVPGRVVRAGGPRRDGGRVGLLRNRRDLVFADRSHRAQR